MRLLQIKNFQHLLLHILHKEKGHNTLTFDFIGRQRWKQGCVVTHKHAKENNENGGVLTKKHSKLNVENISLITSVHPSEIVTIL
uniref:Ovule protein n=1 Tax=Meloidogyne incognita TaxID=6306 RepID=A0A914N3H4_MELIC